LTLPKKIYQTLSFSSEIIVKFLKVIIIVYTLYVLHSLGFFNKAFEVLISIRKGRKHQVFRDLEKSIKEEYTKFEPGKNMDLPQLPFDLYIHQKEPRKPEVKIKLPLWLSYVFVNRDFVYSSLRGDFGSKIPGIFSSIFSKRNSDPKKVDKLVESIIDELSKLDKS